MKLTKTSAHAALAMVYLAHKAGHGLMQARQIAGYLHIPTDSALKILQTLARRGLIRSRLGRAGGYQLQRPAEQITLLEIVEAIEGPISAHMPLTRVQDQLAESICALQSVYQQAASHIRAQLRRATVASLAGGTGGPGGTTSHSKALLTQAGTESS